MSEILVPMSQLPVRKSGCESLVLSQSWRWEEDDGGGRGRWEQLLNGNGI